jgi:arginyl-tRNA synthetase
VTDPVADLAAAVAETASSLHPGGALQPPTLERPRQADFGDYSTNAAMLLAPALGEPPRQIAERLGEVLGERLGAAVERVEVAGPGFLNLFMSDAWCVAGVAALLGAGDGYGRGEPGSGEHIDVEFVSANPTGPIHVAGGRHAAFGDALARTLEAAGHRVEREYYVNDAGSQVRKLGESIKARAQGQPPPEGGYQGEYVAELAGRIEGAAEGDPDDLAARGVELMVGEITATLERFGVHMDRFTSESELYAAGAVQRALGEVEERGHVYKQDGATWLRTTAFGDDKDRVLVRSSGELTYFGADIGYHADKLARGYDRVIDVLGADHHGYLGRMRAAWQALGGAPDGIEFSIMQLVNLTEGGRRVQMSKRAGEFETLDDLVDDIGVDAARWFLLQRSHDTTLDLDLELARSESQDNPVYYVQYAHARIASILRKAGEERVTAALAADLASSPERLHPSARALVKRLLELPEEVRESAERRAPHRVTTYAHETAQAFSAFYRDCKVVGAAEEGGDEDLRIAMSVAAQRVIASSLGLLGVGAPEEM